MLQVQITVEILMHEKWYSGYNLLPFLLLGYGTSGWQAPEQLRCERQTRAVDLFSLGCILFFCITGGKHPFGESIERDVNVIRDQKDLFLIDHIPEATDLISRLLDSNPQLRYSLPIKISCHCNCQFCT